MSVKILLASVLLAVAGGVGAGEFVVAARGEKADCAIVLPTGANAVQTYAAEELRDFVERMTGVRLGIRDEGKGRCVRIVGVEEEKLGEDGFRLVVEGNELRIEASAARGVLYGVYELLERFGGCRWYSSWCERVPSRDVFAVPDDLRDEQAPAFQMREPFWYDVTTHGAFAARVRCNSRSWTTTEAKYGGNAWRFGGGLGSCHTFETLVPIGKYGKTHPEYFAYRDGARRVTPPGGGDHIQWYAQLCLTNLDVLDLVTAGVLARIRKDPGARFYGVSQNDNPYHCQCETCAAVDAEEESHAGTVVRFVNAVAARVEKEFPDAVIETLAYQFSRKPPKKTRLRHNVVPCLCSIECDFARGMLTSPYKENIAFRDDIRGWAKQTDRLYVWDYTTDFAHYTLPFANVYALQENVKFFRDNGVKCLFEQGAYQGRHADFAELKAWLLAKWMWNPELPMKELLDDFFAGYYGAGAPFVRAWFEELHRAQRERSADPAKPLKIFDGVRGGALTDALLATGAGLWAQALAAVADDPVRSYNVRMGSFGVDYARAERLRARGAAEWTFDAAWAARPETLRRNALLESLLARMEEAGDIRLTEGKNGHEKLVADWRRAVSARPALVSGGRLVLEEKDLHLNKPGTWGELADDPAAADGRAMKLFNTHYEWCTTFPMRRVAFEPGARYTVRARVRVEPKAGAAGEAFWAGVYDPAGKRGCGRECRPKVTQVKPGYQWYDVTTWEPKGTEYFWIGPGWYEKKKGEGTSIEGLWIDKIELVKAE